MSLSSAFKNKLKNVILVYEANSETSLNCTFAGFWSTAQYGGENRIGSLPEQQMNLVLEKVNPSMSVHENGIAT